MEYCSDKQLLLLFSCLSVFVLGTPKSRHMETVLLYTVYPQHMF